MFITILVVHMFLNKKFILASNSSSRYQLLKNVGFFWNEFMNSWL